MEQSSAQLRFVSRRANSQGPIRMGMNGSVIRSRQLCTSPASVSSPAFVAVRCPSSYRRRNLATLCQQSPQLASGSPGDSDEASASGSKEHMLPLGDITPPGDPTCSDLLEGQHHPPFSQAVACMHHQASAVCRHHMPCSHAGTCAFPGWCAALRCFACSLEMQGAATVLMNHRAMCTAMHAGACGIDLSFACRHVS